MTHQASKVEEALRESEKRLADIIRFLPDATFAIDLEGKITIWNRAAEEFTGIKAADMLGKGEQEYSVAFYGKKRPMLIDMVINPSAEIEELYSYVRKDEDVFASESYTKSVKYERAYVTGIAGPLCDADGKMIGAIESIRDITEREQTKEKFKESTRLLQLVLDTMPARLFWKDRNSTYLGCNRLVVADAGLTSSAELIGKTDFDTPWKEQAPAFRADDAEVIQTGIPKLNYEERLTDSEGLTMWLRTNKLPLKDSEGQIIGVMGSWEDITEQKKAEAALKEFERRLSLYFQQTMFAVIEWDMDFRVSEWNPAAESIFGYKRGEAIGKSAYDLIVPKDIMEKVSSIWDKLITEAGNILNVNDNITKDGKTITIEWFNTPIVNDEGVVIGVISLAQDITERQSAEKELQELTKTLECRVAERTAQLEASNKELESFVYSVSHDLRAPLRSISGFSQAILEDYYDKLDDMGKDYIDRVLTSSRRMEMLIEDLLRLSRIIRAETQIETVNLSNIAEEVIADLKRAEPEREIVIVIEPDVRVESDRNQLRIVIENLLGNAWKFTGKRPVGEIEFGRMQINGETVYFVKDNGVGFDMEYSNKLFKPFQRLHGDAEFTGTGIGLAIVYRIITRLGGKTWAEAEVDKGATFYFTL